MSSKEFKKTVKHVSKNLEKYTLAMEADVQILINAMLDLIESKIATLRKLLKLKLCINNVKSISTLNRRAILDESSICATYTLSEKPIKKGGSLDDLSSMVYEIDKDSLPDKDNEDFDNINEKKKTKIKCLEDLGDIESLCSALNQPGSKITAITKGLHGENPRVALDKYIFLLLDAERKKEKIKISQSTKDLKKNHIGDCLSNHSNSVQNKKTDPVRNTKSEDSCVYLAKSEYENILDILNTVLESYKNREDKNFSNNKLEKTKTETLIPQEHQGDERKICSDNCCKPKESEKKVRNRKSCCLETK